MLAALSVDIGQRLWVGIHEGAKRHMTGSEQKTAHGEQIEPKSEDCSGRDQEHDFVALQECLDPRLLRLLCGGSNEVGVNPDAGSDRRANALRVPARDDEGPYARCPSHPTPDPVRAALPVC
jgi:hypothetical protein